MRGKQACVHCHFFVKTTRFPQANPFVQLVSKSERAKSRTGEFDWVGPETALSCHLGVWDEGHNFEPSQRSLAIVDAERRDFCFFWRVRPGMFLPAAKALQKREAQLREAKRDRWLTLVGLWIAAIALVINVLLTIANARGWWPF
ncbi:MAG: hypothetical protein KKA32_09315 [Actinobacteria bacterium]|nr:hypothetical protein [Actinomycetota bacterium]